MRLLYCYVHFLNRGGNPEPYRGLEKIEFNFSTADRFSYDFETNTLTRRKRTRPLPEGFWSADPSKGTGTNLYNINVVSGENGSGKTTAIRYLIDLLDGIHAAADPTVKDRDRMEKLDVDGNRTLLLFEEAGRKYLVDYDPFMVKHGKAFKTEGFSEDATHIFQSGDWHDFTKNAVQTSAALSALLNTKVIFMTNALSQGDFERNQGDHNNRLRDYFVYDASIGATIGPDIAQFFPYEVYKQVCYVFDRKQAEKRLAYRKKFPELILPHALRLRLRMDLLKSVDSEDGSSAQDPDDRELPGVLGELCASAFIENLNRLVPFSFSPTTESDSAQINLDRTPYEKISARISAAEEQFEQLRVSSISILEGHSDIVTCVAVTEDGLCVSGSWDNTLRIWDLRSGKRIHTLKGHSGRVTCLAVTPDGLCVSGSLDNTLRVWDLRSGQCLHTLEGHSDWVSCLALTDDGLCVSGSGDNTLRVWDLRSGQCLHTLEGHNYWVTCLALTPDGRCVSGSRDKTLRVWDLRSGHCLHTLKGHSDSVRCLAVTPDGRCVSGSRDHTLRAWDLRSGQCLHTLEGHSDLVTCLAVTPDGRCVSGAREHTLRVWDLRSGQCLHTLEGHEYPVNCLAVTDDGRCVSGSDDKTTRVWDLKTGKCLYCSEKQSDGITCIAVLPDGSIISGNRAGDIILDKSLLPPNEAKLKARALRDACLDYVHFLEKKSDSLFSQFRQINDNTFELSLDALEKLRAKSLEKSEERSERDEEAAKALYRDLIVFLQKYVQTCKPTYTLDFDWGLSSGEENMLRLFSNLYHVFDPDNSGKDSFIYNNESHSGDGKKRTKCDSVLIFLDEADLTLHPEWQRRLILILTTFLPQLFPPDCVKDMQVILSTHSPLLLGDIPGENITYLPSKQKRDTPRALPEETFGQNIHTILKESFFLENGTVGAFAAKRINYIAERLEKIRKQAENAPDGQPLPALEQELRALKREIDIVADGVLRFRLDQLYRAASRAFLSEKNADSEAEELLAKLNQLSPEMKARMLDALNKGGQQP